MSEGEAPKIIVDDDWKSQARAEKEKLAQQDAASKSSGTPSAEQGERSGGLGPGEKPTFDDLVRILATQALMYLGAFPDPQTGKAMVALDIAKINIDLLEIVEQKTKGNLSQDESAMLSGTLHELRLQFVEVAKALETAAAEGKLDQLGGAGMSGGPVPGAGPAGI